MSLINKMLQDLDARGGAGAKAGGESVRSVSVSGARSPAMLAVRTGVALVALALTAWYGWTQWHKPPPFKAPKPLDPALAVPAPAPASVAVPAKAAGNAAPPVAANALPGPDQAALEESRAARAERIEARRKREGELQPARETQAAGQAALAEQLAEAKRKAKAAKAEAKALAAGATEQSATAPRTQPAAQAHVQPRVAARAAPQREAETSGVTVTSQQQGENAYKRALASLQEGRVQDAMASLEQAVFAYPRHDAARQALVGLLLEARRHEEAMRHLQLGLGLDPKQQQMAMLLARLQIERGGPAVETLMRTLPYAGNNPDYLAFLAGALQKGQRHKEAVEQYQAALRLMPQNGVWWMGMGISLQADKRNGEAADAYQRAKASGSLSPELASFVERKLAQLPR
ncbi:tetratricopeptide repeat protein [Duganella sp. FT92W]|uniref:Tetratricopeptide repeat protein n=1 Tax=Pseudoduganella rivuli TaxID=2666085 RepID=A0A7X2IK80_9BURK|nr:tetratricopeptide repeat protein [Pseudoduganella rivuli]MRV71494.1 tetratricopeptide repeat protein [Pseudoduganella rivuli]